MKNIKIRRLNSGLAISDIILDRIELLDKLIPIYNTARYGSDRYIKDLIQKTIRDTSGDLGMSGNFKNGCLYYERGLSETYDRSLDGRVILDHVIPVSVLVERYLRNPVIENLVFSPVARVSFSSNAKLTSKSFDISKSLFQRYFDAGVEIVNARGDVITDDWSEEDHWSLVKEIPVFNPVLKGLGFI